MKFQMKFEINYLVLQRKRRKIQSIDAATIYEVPNLMLEEGLDVVAFKEIDLPKKAVQI
jgi:CTP synthase